MNSGLGGISVQTPGIGVAGQAIHYGKTDTAGSIDLQTQVIMGARHRVVVLMNDKVVSIRAFIAVVEVKPAGMSQTRRGGWWPRVGCNFLAEECHMVVNLRYACLDLSGGGLH